jgi:UDP:flavonoid glycosyltransferase YjiC (YdhE family)
VIPAAESTAAGVLAAASELAADPELPERLERMREHALSGGGPARAATEIVEHARRHGPAAVAVSAMYRR